MNWQNIFSIVWSNSSGLVITTGPALLIIFGSILLLFTPHLRRILSWVKTQRWDVKKVSISTGSLSCEVAPNNDVRRIAYQLWIELRTRKVALPLEENDLIIEVYNSWYSLFTIARNLAKDVPVNHLNNENTKNLINLIMDLLNNQLRPHLTCWQGKFRA